MSTKKPIPSVEEKSQQVVPERCGKCGGPWIPRDHEFMGLIVEDKRCLFCGEDIYHKGVLEKPRRKSKHVKVRPCLGCRKPLEDNRNHSNLYHGTACKWLRQKRMRNE